MAACLSSEAACVQVVEKTEFPYQLTLGKDVGSVAMKVGSPGVNLESLLAGAEPTPILKSHPCEVRLQMQGC